MIVLAAHAPLPTGPAPVVRTAAITDLTVVPNALVVAPSTEVMWTNTGRNRHTVTADGGAFGSGTLIPGDDFTISAPATPGVYDYHCRFHSYIRGTLTVSLVALTVPGPTDFGGTAMLDGTVPGAAAGTPVSVQRRAPGAWVPVGDVVTDASGAFTVSAPGLTARTAFRALAVDTVSPSVRVEVRPTVGLRRNGRRLTVSVRPAAAVPVRLQVLNLDTYRWSDVARARLSGGHARFTLAAPGVYRAEVDAHAGLSARASGPVQYRPGAFRQ